MKILTPNFRKIGKVFAELKRGQIHNFIDIS